MPSRHLKNLNVESLLLYFRMKRIAEITSERSQYEASIQSTQAHINNLSHNISSCAAREKEFKSHLIRMNNEIGKKEKELLGIQRQRDNKLIIFGEGYPKLIQEIEKNKKKVMSSNSSLIIIPVA